MKTEIDIILLSLSIIIFALLAGNIYLLLLAKKFFRVKSKNRLYPLGFDYSTNHQLLSKPIPGEVKVVFFGDSRIEDWPSPKIEGFWFANQGHGSLTSHELRRIYNDVILPLEPSILVVQMGINDLKVIPLYPKRKEQIINACKDNIKKIIQWTSNKNTLIIFTTIFPIGRIPIYRKFLWSGNILAEIDDVNTFIKSQSNKNVIILDTFSILADKNRRLQRKYSRDEFHVNAAGYSLINSELINLIKSIKEYSI